MACRCSISIFFSSLCVLVSITFSVICIYILIQERLEVDLSFKTSLEQKIIDRSKYTQLIESQYDLERDVDKFMKRLQNYRYQYHKLNLEKLLCIPLKELFPNRSELVLERIGEELVVNLNRTFYNQLNGKSGKSKSEKRRTLKIFDLTVLNSLRSHYYYILRNRLCLQVEYFYTESYLNQLFPNVSSAHMLIKDSYHVVQLKNDTAFDLRLIFNDNNPNLNCSKNDSEFECLNSCFKSGSRLSKYFYNGNETGSIQVAGKLPEQWSNRSAYDLVEQHEQECFAECNKTQCVVTDFQKKSFEGKYSSNLIKVSFFEFSPLMSDFSFWVQLTGLTLSFFGISCYNLALKLVANSLIRNQKRIRTLFRVLLWIACLFVLLLMSSQAISNFSKRMGDRSSKTAITYTKKSEQIGLVVCVSVNAFSLSENTTQQLTLAELEQTTDDFFNRTVKEMFIEFINERLGDEEVKWTVSKKVFFNVNDFTSELGRCTQVQIEAEEPKYHNIWSEFKLVVTFHQPNYEVYVLPEGKNFNYNSFRITPGKTTKFNKVIFKSSPLTCTDYNKEYSSSCDSRWSCLDECVVNKSIKYDLDLPIIHVIDKDLFEPEDWAELQPNYNLKGDPKIEDECREEISSPDCYKIYFEKDDKGDQLESGADWRKVKIDLHHAILLKTAADESSGYDVLLDLLNIQTIIFDLPVLKLLTMVAIFFQIKVFELHFVTRKLFLFPVYLLCLVGFSLHVLFIFSQVRDDRLVFSKYFEVIEVMDIPEVVFCFEINDRFEKLNSSGEFSGLNTTAYESRKLTGNHLEMVTQDIRVNTVFEKISYLNNSGEWVDLRVNETNFQNQGVRFKRFYFSDKKCVSVDINQSYNRSQFYFDDTSDDTYPVLRIEFNRTFIESRLVTFFSRSSDKRHLSNIKFLNYTSPADEDLKTSFSILQEHFGKFRSLV